MNSFNLVDEQWIPVLYNDGHFTRVGIQKALKDAGGIREIATSNPMDRVAILRFLLAVLYWCQGNPEGQEEKDRLLTEGQFPPEWFSKLREKRNHFNLLGSGERFYQDSAAERQRAVTDLLQEIPTGNNFWHFKHSTDYNEGLCAACCAIGLLRLPIFSVSGLPDLKAGINGTPPIYMIPVGQALLHTLCLNWNFRDSLGHPAWDKSKLASVEGTPVPLLNGLTMLSRRVWLHDATPTDGLCIGCGGQSALIHVCKYQSAGLLRSDKWDDPHVIYLQKKNKDGLTERKSLTTPDLTKSSFRMDKPWTSLFAGTGASTRFYRDMESIRLFVVGFATDKAKNIDVWERTWTIPSAPVAQHIKAAELVSLWNAEGKRLAKRLAVRLKPKNSNSHYLEFVVATTAIGPHVESQVSGQVTELLANPAQSWPKAVEEYRQRITDIATSLAPGFTIKGLRRRDEIACTLPNMTSQSATRRASPKLKEASNNDSH